MDRWLHATAFVVVGTVAGLAHPMIILGPGLFVEVWSASVLGDVVFTVGMLGTYLTARKTAERAPGVPILGVSFALTWLTYSLAWSITGNAMEEGLGSNPLVFTATWGWPGLIACGLIPWAQHALEEKARKPEASPMPSVDGTDDP